MNPTHKRTQAENEAKRQTSASQLAHLASADLSSAPPASEDDYGGPKQIMHAHKPLLQRYAYYDQETRAAAVAMVIGLLLAIAVLMLFGLNLLTIGVASIAVITALLGGYYWYFKRYGAEYISVQRWKDAREQLRDSGDENFVPMAFLGMLALVGIAGVDGFPSGGSLSGIFQNSFTPNIALMFAAAWGIGATYLLFKMAYAAALEANTNERRALIRNLISSNEPEDQARGKRMKAAVGDVLGQSLHLDDDKKSARVGLVCAALVISVSMFAMRIGGQEGDEAATSKQPTMEQTRYIKV